MTGIIFVLVSLFGIGFVMLGFSWIAATKRASVWEGRYFRLFDDVNQALRVANLDSTTYAEIESALRRSQPEREIGR